MTLRDQKHNLILCLLCTVLTAFISFHTILNQASARSDSLDKVLARRTLLEDFREHLKDPMFYSIDRRLNGTTHFVRPDGADHSAGTELEPLRTIQEAVRRAQPGDRILVGHGTYVDQSDDGDSFILIDKSGRKDAWISIEPIPGERATIVTSAWNAIELRRAAFIQIRDLNLIGIPDALSEFAGNGLFVNDSHHVRIVDNTLYGFGGGGIATIYSDYVLIDGNDVRKTSETSYFGNSGISLWRSRVHDLQDGYHFVIHNNTSTNNRNVVPARSTGEISDGNGIIVDRHELDSDDDRIRPYRHRVLVARNRATSNGGRGIHIFRSNNVDIVENYVANNNETPEIFDGEITLRIARDIRIEGNTVIQGKGSRREYLFDRGSARFLD